MSTHKVFIAGDCHGSHDIGKLKSFALAHPELTKEDYVIICGDFGLLWNNSYFIENYGAEQLKVPKNSWDNLWSAEEVNLYYWYEKLPWTTLFVDG